MIRLKHTSLVLHPISHLHCVLQLNKTMFSWKYYIFETVFFLYTEHSYFFLFPSLCPWEHPANLSSSDLVQSPQMKLSLTFSRLSYMVEYKMSFPFTTVFQKRSSTLILYKVSYIMEILSISLLNNNLFGGSSFKKKWLLLVLKDVPDKIG